VAGRIADGRVLELIQYFLKQDIMEDMTRWTPTSGSPQGAVVSPLLANRFCRSKERGTNESDMMRIAYAANE
jgi:RNA-directed DNA polymerase